MKDKALKLGKKFLRHELVKGSSFIFFGTTLANIFAFLFNLLLVRSLTYSEYGEYAAVISLFTLLSIPAQSLQPVLVRFNSEFISKKQLGKAERFYKQTFLSFISFSIIFFLLFILFMPFLKTYFHIPNALSLLIAGAIVCFTYISIPNTALLQSMLQFPFLSLTTVLGAFARLSIGFTLIWLGFRVVGGLWALLLSLFLPFIFSFIPLRNFFSTPEDEEHVSWREILSYGLPSAVALFALASFTSTDVLLVKHFFSTNNAGLYAGLSLIGKVIFYFTAPITTVMFPIVTKQYEEGKRFQNVFYLALLLVCFPSISITLFYFLFPHIAITLFLGQKYQIIAPYLGWFGIFLCLFSVLNVTVNFFLSVKRTEVVYLVGLGALLQATLIVFFHSNFLQIIIISTLILLLLFAILLLYYSQNFSYVKNKK